MPTAGEAITKGKLRPSSDVISRRVGEEFLLIDLNSDQMYSLNRTGARAWELLSEGEDADTIEAVLAEEFEVDGTEARREFESLLEQLTRANLVIES